MNIEKEWTTVEGYTAKVIAHPAGHRCGYVILPENHPAYGKDYDELSNIDVHGGLTFGDGGMFGFDCAHWDDAKDPSIMDPSIMDPEYVGFFDVYSSGESSIKTLDFCIAECESMAKQFKDMENA